MTALNMRLQLILAVATFVVTALDGAIEDAQARLMLFGVAVEVGGTVEGLVACRADCAGGMGFVLVHAAGMIGVVGLAHGTGVVDLAVVSSAAIVVGLAGVHGVASVMEVAGVGSISIVGDLAVAHSEASVMDVAGGGGRGIVVNLAVVHRVTSVVNLAGINTVASIFRDARVVEPEGETRAWSSSRRIRQRIFEGASERSVDGLGHSESRRVGIRLKVSVGPIRNCEGQHEMAACVEVQELHSRK